MQTYYYGVKVQFHPATEHRGASISASACRWYDGKPPRIQRSRNYAFGFADDAAALAMEYMNKIVLPKRAELWGDAGVHESAEAVGVTECDDGTLIALFNIK